MYQFSVEGIPFVIFTSVHAEQRMHTREVNLCSVCESIASLDEQLLDMRNKEVFCVCDEELGVKVICSIEFGEEMFIHVITVLSADMTVYHRTPIYFVNPLYKEEFVMNNKIKEILFIRLEREMNQGDVAAAQRTMVEIYDMEEESGYVDTRLIEYMEVLEKAVA